MCGIAASFAYSADAPPIDRDELLRVRDQMASRGPDGAGEWFSPDGRIGLAHRRLSIIDLSPSGAQPMWNAERTLAIVFNGEIYNYEALRGGLAASGYVFQSHCDTEVLLALYQTKGQAMLDELRGMYAFVIWDARRRALFAARDPLGIKPLFYSDDGRTIRFASQVKALLCNKYVDSSPEPAGHVGFFLWGSVPWPYTLYRGIRNLIAGHTVEVAEHGAVKVTRYCTIPDLLEQGARAGDCRSALAPDALQHAIADSVEHHLVADVPVGVFLSSGLDSTTLAAFARERHSDLKTVTLGFDEYRGTENDEVPLAEETARLLGADHRTIWVSRADFEAESARLFEAMDQPSIDGVNTYFVSLAAKRAGLKVALSGLGGDELFGGYEGFAQIPRAVRLLRPFRHFPWFARAVRHAVLPFVSPNASTKYAGVLEYAPTLAGAYLLRRALFMPWELGSVLPPELVREGWETLNALGMLEETLRNVPASDRLQVSSLEMSFYMRNQLLRDADWAGMAHSVEIRVPFVDQQLLLTLAPSLASAHPPTKRDMAQAAPARLPDAVLQRPKTGFVVPVRDWLLQSFDPTLGRERGLRGWAREVYSRFADPTAMHHFARRQRRGAGARAAEVQDRSVRTGDLHALMLVTDAFGGFGGIATYGRDFIAALCADPRLAEVVAVPRLMPRAPGVLPEKFSMITDGLGGKWAYIRAVLRVALQLRRRVRRREMIIFCGHINLLPIAALAKIICGGSLHLLVYGIDAWKPLRDPAVRAALRMIDSFIAISQVTKQRFQHWTGLRSDQGMILPCAIEMDAFTAGPAPAELCARYGLQNSTVLMTLGRLASVERYKGFDEVIELLPRLHERFPEIAYLICGDGPDRARLVAKAQSLGCDVSVVGEDHRHEEPQAGRGARVVFAGEVTEREKANHYRLADLYVMPSYGEGFGIVYLEAMACGLPVIGSKADGSREPLREGRLGQLVDPRDPEQIFQAITEALHRAANGAPAVDRAEVEYFSQSRFRERVRRMIEAIAPLPAR